MKQEDAEEYTQALGQVVAGSWRQIALAQRLGVPKALNLSVQEWVTQRLGGYVQLSLEERKTAALELRAEGLSYRKIAGTLGVNEATIHRDINEPDVANATVSQGQTLGDMSMNVANATAEIADIAGRLDDLENARAHVVSAKQRYKDHPEQYAEDELYDWLDGALTQCLETICILELHPMARAALGAPSNDDWNQLLRQFKSLLKRITDWREIRKELSA
jgi:Helix-turn-helix domain